MHTPICLSSLKCCHYVRSSQLFRMSNTVAFKCPGTRRPKPVPAPRCPVHKATSKRSWWALISSPLNIFEKSRNASCTSAFVSLNLLCHCACKRHILEATFQRPRGNIFPKRSQTFGHEVHLRYILEELRKHTWKLNTELTQVWGRTNNPGVVRQLLDQLPHHPKARSSWRVCASSFTGLMCTNTYCIHVHESLWKTAPVTFHQSILYITSS